MLVNGLLPDPNCRASGPFLVVRGWRHDWDRERLDGEADVSSILVGATDKFGNFLCGLDELVRLPGIRRIVDVPLEVWALAFKLWSPWRKSFSVVRSVVLLLLVCLLLRWGG